MVSRQPPFGGFRRRRSDTHAVSVRYLPPRVSGRSDRLAAPLAPFGAGRPLQPDSLCRPWLPSAPSAASSSPDLYRPREPRGCGVDRLMSIGILPGRCDDLLAVLFRRAAAHSGAAGGVFVFPDLYRPREPRGRLGLCLNLIRSSYGARPSQAGAAGAFQTRVVGFSAILRVTSRLP